MKLFSWFKIAQQASQSSSTEYAVLTVLAKVFETKRNTAQKMKFFIRNSFSKCDQIRRKLQIWSHFLNKLLMENFIFCAVKVTENSQTKLCPTFDIRAKISVALDPLKCCGFSVISTRGPSATIHFRIFFLREIWCKNF